MGRCMKILTAAACSRPVAEVSVAGGLRPPGTRGVCTPRTNLAGPRTEGDGSTGTTRMSAWVKV